MLRAGLTIVHVFRETVKP